jgi:hypothetical protein
MAHKRKKFRVFLKFKIPVDRCFPFDVKKQTQHDSREKKKRKRGETKQNKLDPPTTPLFGKEDGERDRASSARGLSFAFFFLFFVCVSSVCLCAERFNQRERGRGFKREGIWQILSQIVLSEL